MVNLPLLTDGMRRLHDGGVSFRFRIDITTGTWFDHGDPLNLQQGWVAKAMTVREFDDGDTYMESPGLPLGLIATGASAGEVASLVAERLPHIAWDKVAELEAAAHETRHPVHVRLEGDQTIGLCTHHAAMLTLVADDPAGDFNDEQLAAAGENLGQRLVALDHRGGLRAWDDLMSGEWQDCPNCWVISARFDIEEVMVIASALVPLGDEPEPSAARPGSVADEVVGEEETPGGD